MEHLCGYDNRLFGQDTLLNQDTLYAWDAFLRYFDAQISPGNHDAVCLFQNFIDVIHAFLILDFCDNFDVAAVCVQNFADVQNVLLVADERMGDEIYVFFDGIKDVVTVFFCEGWQIDAYTRHVHAFATGQCRIVAYFAIQSFFILIRYFQFKVSIVYQYLGTYG